MKRCGHRHLYNDGRGVATGTLNSMVLENTPTGDDAWARAKSTRYAET